MGPRSLGRKTLTVEEAREFTKELMNRADKLGIPLERWVLNVGKPNDIRIGKGPRFSIVAFAQEMAALGATYGAVLGRTVMQGDGRKYVIRHHDLAGFVCANGYCTIRPPEC